MQVCPVPFAGGTGYALKSDGDTWTSLATPALSLDGTSTWARLLDVHDGDTITVAALVYGLDRPRQIHIRLVGLDAPEVTRKERQTRGEMRALLQARVIPVFLRFGQNDKYGRALARVSTSDAEGSPHVGLALIREGLATTF